MVGGKLGTGAEKQAPLRPKSLVDDRSIGALRRMTGWHLFLNVTVQKSIERHTGRERILCLLVQLHNEALRC